MLNFIKRILNMATITVNKMSYEGRTIESRNGRIFINGKDITPDTKEINITVTGDIDKLSVDFGETITVTGNVNKLHSGTAKVIVNGDVNGPVDCGTGDLKCGNITGNVDCGTGDVDALVIHGKVESGTGDIITKK
jgi:hypothetical protein